MLPDLRSNSAVRAFFLAGIISAAPLCAQTFLWNVDANGTWGVNSNWSPSTGNPDAVDDVASFGSAITADRTVTISAIQTVGSILFNDNNNYTITRTSSYILMDVSSGSATITINNSNGNGAHRIDAQIRLNDALTITNNSTGEFWISRQLRTQGNTITVDGPGNTRITANTRDGGGIIKNGTGTLFLSGNKTYTGTTVINNGIVVVLNNKGLGDTGTGTTVNSGSTLEIRGGRSIAEPLTLNGTGFGGAGALHHTGTVSANDTWSGSITLGSNSSIISDTGVLTLSSANPLTLGANTVTFGGAGNVTVSRAVGGTGGVTKTGTGTLTLSGTNTYTGTTLISDGVVSARNNSALGTAAAGTTVASGASLYLSNNITLTEGTVTVSGTGEAAAGAIRNNADTNTLAAPVSLAADSTFLSAAGSLTLSGAVAQNNFNLILDGDGILNTSSTLGLGSGSLLITGAGGRTLSGVISGTGAVTKDGTGTAVFSGANTYTGSTTVSAGTLQAGAASSFASSSAHTVASGATLDLNSFSQSVASLAGAGNVTLGSGTLTTGGSNASTTFSGGITGTGGVTKTGTGTFTLSGANTYSGTTTLSTGTLQAGAANAFSANSTHAIASGTTLDLNSASQSVGALSGAGSVTLGSGTLTAGLNNASTTFSGVVSGTGGLVKDGSGTMTATAANTFNGPLTVDEGTLTFSGASGAAASASSVTINTGATLGLDNSAGENTNRISNSASVTLNGGGFTFTGDSNGSTETVGSLNASGGASTVTVAHNGAATDVTSLTFGSLGTISGGASVNFLGTGGTLGSATGGPRIFITGMTTGFVGGWATVGSDFAEYDATYGVKALTGYYTGPLGININNPASNVILTSTSPVGAYTLDTGQPDTTITDNSLLLTDVATVNLNTNAAYSLNLVSGGLLKTTTTNTSITGTGRLTAGGSAAGTLSVTVQSTGNLSIGAVIIDNPGGAVKVQKGGIGELVLTATNTHTGGTELDAGTLSLGNNSALGTGTLTLSGGTIRSSGGARTFTNAVTLGGNTTFGGADTLAFSGATSLTGPRTLTTDIGTTFSGVISGAGSLTKAGTATLTLSGTGANTYAGATTVNAGTLSLGKTAGTNAIAGNIFIGDGTGTDTVQLAASNQIADTSAVTINSSGVLDLNGNSDTVGAITLTSGSSIITGAGTLTLNGGVTRDTAGSSAATLAGNLSLGGATRTFTVNDAAAATDLSISAIISNGSLTKTGTGLLQISGTNTYTGATTVSGGTLQAGAANVLTTSTALNVGSGATFNLNNFNQSVGSLAGNGSIILGTAALTTGGDNTSTTFSGVLGILGGSGSLTKTGTGTQTLSGINSYTGATTVSGGTLRIESSGALGTTAAGTSVSSGAALAIAGSITVTGETLTLNGTGVSSGGALRNISGDNVWDGAITLGSAASIASDSGTLTLSGTVANGANLLTLSGSGDIAVTGVISGSGGLTKSGAGILSLSAANTYTGTTTISSGEVTLFDSAGLGANGGANGVTVASGAALNLNDALATISTGNKPITLNGTGVGGNGAIRNISGDNTLGGTVTLGSAATINVESDSLTLSNASSVATAGFALTVTGVGDTTISGVVSGTGSLVKSGSGILSLSGTAANTYSGTTTVNAGTLSLDKTAGTNAIAGGTVTVNSGGTLLLGASNQIADTVNLTLAGGTLQMNDQSETLGTLTLTANSSIDFAGSGTSVLSFAGLNLGGFTLTILNWSGTVTGYGNDQLIFRDPTGLPAPGSSTSGIRFGSPTGPSGLVISHPVTGFPSAVEIVPEPSTWAFFALLTASLAGAELRRRKAGAQNLA